ncbi:MAG TPA: Hsp20/alpha crystallin family protein [Geminicoccaceae bacterium]|nr:Hsp20/alpha crystallin family protein [Geminicoccaceae bacterium]
MADVTSKQATAQAAAPVPRAEEGARHPLLALRREVDRLFDDFFTGFSLAPFGRGFEADPWRRFQSTLGMAHPAVDAAENEKEYRITAELPGLTEKDVEVSLVNGTLTLKGEKKEEKEERKENYYMAERRRGSFQRSFRLPEDVDPGGIAASCKDGVLTIILPKSAQAQAKRKKIDVKAA